MNGFHKQSSLLCALTKHQVIPSDMTEEISANFVLQHKTFIRYLVDDLALNSVLIAHALSHYFGYPLFDLTSYNIDTTPTKTCNETLVRKHNALPIFLRGKVLFVAMSDPTNLDALEEIKFNTGFSTELILVDEKFLTVCIDKVFEEDCATLDISEADTEQLSSIYVQEDSQQTNYINNNDKEDAPIIVYINKILRDAIRRGASDLHFEPYEKYYRIRFRVDGMLTQIAKPPISLASRIAARLKVMSKLDIAERRIPQDGRIKLAISKEKSIDFRVSTLPTMWGEKVVIRILDASNTMLGIDMLGYTHIQKKIYIDALAQPQGMILVTGPTGSGKTVSLYTGLSILNTQEHNISTVEDPVEINIDGVNQVQINTKSGLTFPNTLRSFLRQDPDIIMVGEIRDLETAEIAIKAAQTGHLVLSTLHTNSAAETLTRLLNMGVAAYNVASSITVIIAQRLARKLCSRCKTQEYIPQSELLNQGFLAEQLSKIKLYKAVGCEHCTAGYIGRIGIYEVIKISDTIANLIMNGGNSLDISAQYQREGYNNLRQSGLEKAALGITSLEEINRITSL